MKAIQCEMCGGTDLVKSEGLFVCRQCGMKYTLEEARKLMIDDAVEVKAVESANKSGELENLIVLAERAKEEGNYQSAANYYDGILRLDPNNCRANFYKSYCETMGSKIINLIGNFTTTTSTAVSTINMLLKQEPVDFKACSDIVLSISELARICFVNKYNIYNENPEYNQVLYGGQVITHNQGGYNRLQQDCEKIIDTALTFYSCCYSLKEANADFLKVTETALNRLKDNFDSIPTAPYEGALLYKKVYNSLCEINYGIRSRISFHIDKTRERLTVVSNAEARVARAKAEQNAKEQRERNESYWSEHPGEKQALETEAESLKAEVEQLKGQIAPFEKEINELKNRREDDVPAKEEKSKLQDKISALTSEMQALGLFKSKEKKALQAQIDELYSGFSVINEKIEAEEKEKIKLCNDKIREIEQNAKPIKDKITELQKRIGEINKELTKNR